MEFFDYPASGLSVGSRCADGRRDDVFAISLTAQSVVDDGHVYTHQLTDGSAILNWGTDYSTWITTHLK
jgi:hypothetical protein